MDGTAVKEIASLADLSKVIEVDGKTFSRATYHPVIFDPRPEPIKAKTLTGLVDYINAKTFDAVDLSKCVVHIVDYSSVELVEAYSGMDKERTVYFIAKLDENLPVFPFDQYMAIEDFIVKARALFTPSHDLDSVITIVSRVVSQDAVETLDNGISQAVTVKRGVSGGLTEKTETAGFYELAPYRTFREIPQPTSSFILRLKPKEGGLPQVALFDTNNKRWRHIAMIDIANELRGILPDMTVIV